MSSSLSPLAVIGLGYVGLPLAVAFGARRPVVGFDISAQRVAELARGHDRTLETTPEELAEAAHLQVTATAADLAACTVYILSPLPI